MSESCLARSIHLLTLGAYCWEDKSDDIEWTKCGGGGVGSVFHGRISCPGPQDWVKSVMLESPESIMHSDFFSKEDNILILLHRLASKGVGRGGSFVVQDSSLRSGAAWLCKYAARNNQSAADIVEGAVNKVSKNSDDLERRKQEAKERALMKMKGFQAKFIDSLLPSGADRSGSEPTRLDQESFCSEESKTDKNEDACMDSDLENNVKEIRTGLLKERPRCIVCDEDGTSSSQECGKYASGDHSDALAFCGFAQASMVLKGCSKPIQSPPKFSSVHISLCGHAIHSSCCNAYLASTGMRDSLVDPGKDGEFRCPLCKRFSNCLVPFIDIDRCWVESPQNCSDKGKKSDRGYEGDIFVDEMLKSQNISSLHNFLSPDNFLIDNSCWDGRCNFHNFECPFTDKGGPEEYEPEASKMCRRRPFGKKDLWSLVMRSPRKKKKSPKLTSSVSHDLSNDELPGSSTVFRRLAEQLSDVAHKVDLRYINEHNLTYFGEFRHHLTEQLLYNIHGRNQILSPISEVS
jgi:hypothetical protein